MPIEVTCNSCGATLRVADHHAGRSAKCPQCENVFRVPAQPTPEAPATPPPPPEPTASFELPTSAAVRWQIRTPDGQIYGPASESDINQWIVENRVTASCQACREGETNWQPAPAVFSQLSVPSANPYADVNPHANPYAAPRQPSVGSFSKPHRGGTVLTLGILGIACCGIMAPIAWVMGHTDIKEIDAGVMDPSGRGLTQAGMIIGIVGTVIFVLSSGAVGLGFLADM